MAAKNEPTAAAPAANPAEAAPPKSGGGLKAWLPAIATVLLAPAVSFAVAQYVLLPKLRDSLNMAPEAVTPAGHAPAGGHEAGGAHSRQSSVAPGTTYKMENIVVNLAGTMGTRYLKCTFVVTGSDAKLTGEFEARKTQLVDVTLNVLSSLSLADLEEAGAKNLIREKLVAAFNQTLGRRVAEQVYFSDFVVQ